MNLYQVVKRPLITEKTSAQREGANKYVFEVVTSATKIDVKRAVSQIFNVHVIEVRTISLQRKPKKNPRTGRMSKAVNWKKAIVTLKAGEKIQLFEGA